MAKYLYMGPMYESMGKNQIIVGVKWASNSKIGNQRVALQVRNKRGGPIGGNYDGVIVYLVEVVEIVSIGWQY